MSTKKAPTPAACKKLKLALVKYIKCRDALNRFIDRAPNYGIDRSGLMTPARQKLENACTRARHAMEKAEASFGRETAVPFGLVGGLTNAEWEARHEKHAR